MGDGRSSGRRRVELELQLVAGVLKPVLDGRVLEGEELELRHGFSGPLRIELLDFDDPETGARWQVRAAHGERRGTVEWLRWPGGCGHNFFEPSAGAFVVEIHARDSDDGSRTLTTSLRLRLSSANYGEEQTGAKPGVPRAPRPSAAQPGPVPKGLEIEDDDGEGAEAEEAAEEVDDDAELSLDEAPEPPSSDPGFVETRLTPTFDSARKAAPPAPEPFLGGESAAPVEKERVRGPARREQERRDRAIPLSAPRPDAVRGRPKPTPKAAPEPAPAPAPADVEFGASAPARIRPGDEFTARFVAYLEDQQAEVGELLERLEPGNRRQLGGARARWRPGVEVEVELRARGLEIDDPIQRFVWSGERELLSFDVYVPEDARPRNTVLKFDVRVFGLPTGRVRLDLELLAPGSRPAPDERREGRARSYRSAFASYSTKDRLRVLDHVMAIQRLTGMDVFLDCISLRGGEDFEGRIFEEVAARELYILFWSRSASESSWVDREWRLAFANKEPEAFMVQPLEPFHEAPPPAELGHLNFNDPMLMIRAATELMQQQP